ncbi:MAG TPA: GNAT family N-acetyltransferase [Propionibacteriaceae bacterium]|nr:GNAT family N-acetyltransferase [Propionibacteriaceae bacterium]
MPFRIVRAEPEDWEAIRAIRLRSLSEEPQAYAADYETEARYRPELWQERLATAFSCLAFDDDHDLVGIATGVWTGDRDTHVVGMYVAPEARGHGCAHQLLDAIADLAIRRQGQTVAARGGRVQRARRPLLPLVWLCRDRSSAPDGSGPQYH